MSSIIVKPDDICHYLVLTSSSPIAKIAFKGNWTLSTNVFTWFYIEDAIFNQFKLVFSKPSNL